MTNEEYFTRERVNAFNTTRGILTNSIIVRLIKYSLFIGVISFMVLVTSDNYNDFFVTAKILLIPVGMVELYCLWVRNKARFDYTHSWTDNVKRLREEGVIPDFDSVNDGVVSVEKDLNYWFGLFEKGAITEEQYNDKREALLSN